MFIKKIIKYFFLTSLTSLCIVLVYGCTSKELNNNKLSDESENVIKIEGVAALGKLIPLGDVRKLAAPTSGKGGTPRISKLLVEEGDYIVSDQVLAIFDNSSKLEADLAVEIAKLNILTNQINIQERELIRYQALVSNEVVPVINLEEIEDQIVILMGKKEQILSSMNAIQIDLEQTQLKSPINGVVLQVLAREGERPDSSGVLKVGANQLMEALIEVYESDIDRVKTGQVVNLISENGGFKGSLKGKVSLISPQVRQRRVLSTDPTGDADSRVVEVRVKLDNVSAKMVSHLTGMKVIARFKSE